MKTIKYNRNQLLGNIAKILVLLDRPCMVFTYEPENPKLKHLNPKE
jgi:hypothetical protein